NAMKGGAAAMDDEDEEEVATEEGVAPEATEAAAE
ncbi:MAG: 50S ribosomal protein L25, partial [Chryseobacterium gambrini]|nr:50S ribosomal protein L25 [Chryseobacterium gambrini]